MDRKRRSKKRQPQPCSAASRVVAWEWDAGADRITASENLRDVYGVPAIESVSRGFSLVHADDYDRHQALVHAAVDRGRGYRSSFRIVRPDTGRVVWIEERAEAIGRGCAGPPLLIGLALEANVRYDRPVVRAAVRALDGLDQFGETVLTAYAINLRTTPQLHKRGAAGAWIQWAQQRLAERTPAD